MGSRKRAAFMECTPAAALASVAEAAECAKCSLQMPKGHPQDLNMQTEELNYGYWELEWFHL